MTNLETLKQQTADLEAKLEEMKAEIDRLENGWEMKCPYKNGDTHYCLQPSGDVFQDCWEGIEADNKYFSQGNTFPTEQAAKLEAKRRNLLTRFRAFRDECNDGWTPDWTKNREKISLYYKPEDKIFYMDTCFIANTFNLFGYFKNKQDAQRAIDLFGDEIKELFVEV